jgi:hypothetical protein
MSDYERIRDGALKEALRGIGADLSSALDRAAETIRESRGDALQEIADVYRAGSESGDTYWELETLTAIGEILQRSGALGGEQE